MMQPIFVRSGRNPHAIALSVALAFISVYGLIDSPASASIDSGLTVGQRVMFGGCGFLGAVLIFVGIFWRGRAETALMLERIGQILMMTGSTVYVVVLCKVSTFDRSGLITSIGIALALGSLGRIVQIGRDLRTLRVTRTNARSTDGR